ncbi:MAG: hypothetical protein WC421_07295 [Elusimicrobiales bacterium]
MIYRAVLWTGAFALLCLLATVALAASGRSHHITAAAAVTLALVHASLAAYKQFRFRRPAIPPGGAGK